MKLVLKKKYSAKLVNRIKKKVRIRKKLSGSTEQPRLCVFRSSKHIYATLVNDSNGQTIVSYSSLSVEKKMNGNDMASFVGQELAKLAKSKSITEVVFDRNGYLYHGRVKSLADGARLGGLKF